MLSGNIRLLALAFAAWLGIVAGARATPLDFTVTHKGEGSPVVLIVGGIQGDEPGGFSAAALLATRYRFTKGTVMVVPNLNFPSIIERSRGLHGDMNRKFADLNDSDPEYGTVRRIQTLIAAKDVDLVLNLHDGSGFYRPQRESATHNPDRWGQSVIIDQEELPGALYSHLRGMAQIAAGDANRVLLDKTHAIHVRNTQTADAPKGEMSKCLTWFALSQGKSAFGLEASKDFGVSQRVYYHLNMTESLLKQAGVEFERDFPLSLAGIDKALGSNVRVAFLNNRLVLPLDNARRQLIGTLPLPRGAERFADPSMPIMAVLPGNGNTINVHYGNRMVTSFKPDWTETDDTLASVTVRVDGQPQEVRFGDTILVGSHFLVEPMEGCRVNAIGTNLGKDESNIALRRRDFQQAYSIDKAGTLYRVEVYRGQRYAGTFLARFGAAAAPSPTLPAVPGKESDLGW